MGVLGSQPASLIKTAQPTNTTPVKKLHPLKLFPHLQTTHYMRIYNKQTESNLQIVYKFGQQLYIPLLLTKKHIYTTKKPEQQAYYNNNQYVYSYKVKYRYRTDKVKNILYKKRIYGQIGYVVDCIAEMKLMSLYQFGPYVGQMLDNSDGYLCGEYGEYFGETLTKFQENQDNIINKLRENFTVTSQHISQHQKGFSQFFHSQCLKPRLPQAQPPPQYIYEPPHQQQQPLQMRTSIKPSVLSIKFLQKMKKIDEKTNMLSSIQNSLFHKDIQKTITVYEERVNNIVSPIDRIKYVCQFVDLLAECGWFKEFQEQVIEETLSGNQVYLSEDVLGKSYRKHLQERQAWIKLKSKDFSSEGQLDQFSQSHSIAQPQIQKQRIKLNIRESNKNRTRQLVNSLKSTPNNSSLHPGTQHMSLQPLMEINIESAEMLMKQGKSRQALVFFQFLLRNSTIDVDQKSKIAINMGLIYYYRSCFEQAIKQWERALLWMIRIKLYNGIMTLVYNNIGCAFYKQQKYQLAIDLFIYALKHEPGKNDHTFLLRNNLALAYLKTNQQKLAKQVIIQLLNLDEPVNNPIILSKIYTNFGFLSMKSKQFTKAKQQLKLALYLQQKCLIPNGYQISKYLHNNLAITFHKLGQFKYALDCILKYLQTFNQFKGQQGFYINFNIALIFKHNYRVQLATQYLDKCRGFLQKFPTKIKQKYQARLNQQQNSISKYVIDQAMEQEYEMGSSMVRRYQRSNRMHKFGGLKNVQ